MKTIYKYALKLQNRQTILLPSGYEILSVQTQFNRIVIWAKIEDEIFDEVPIEIYATGEPINEDKFL